MRELRIREATSSDLIFRSLELFSEMAISMFSWIFKKYFIYLFLQRRGGKGKERERKINVWLPFAHPLLGTWPATQACALTGNRTGNPLVHRPALNPLSYISQGQCFGGF